MERYVQIVLTVLLLCEASACSPVTHAAQEATSISQPASAGAYHPLTTQTGIAEIDHVLDVVASGDVEELRSLIHFTNAKCTQRDGLGGPPKCRAGEAEGTPYEVLPFLGPDGSFFRKDEIDRWPGIEASGIYAIYEVSPGAFSDENYPAGEYAILFISKENESAVSLHVSNGKIVRLDYNFENSPEALDKWLQREASRMILAPLTPHSR